jgi:hypothetical protein
VGGSRWPRALPAPPFSPPPPSLPLPFRFRVELGRRLTVSESW